MANCISIVGIRAHNRAEVGPKVQEVLTVHGDSIISRSGVPSPDKKTGVITIVVSGSEDDAKKLASDLKKIPGVNAEHMTLECALD